MSITDIVAPPIEPVTLVAAKEFLRIDGDHEDALITDLIKVARERVEFMGRLSLIARRRAYATTRVCAGRFVINHSPIKYVHKVSVIDGDDNAIEIPKGEIYINKRARPAVIEVRKRHVFSDYAADPVAVVAELDAGYGSAPEDVPMQLRQAVLLLLAQHYEHRDDALTRPVPMLVDALLMSYRTVRL